MLTKPGYDNGLGLECADDSPGASYVLYVVENYRQLHAAGATQALQTEIARVLQRFCEGDNVAPDSIVLRDGFAIGCKRADWQSRNTARELKSESLSEGLNLLPVRCEKQDVLVHISKMTFRSWHAMQPVLQSLLAARNASVWPQENLAPSGQMATLKQAIAAAQLQSGEALMLEFMQLMHQGNVSLAFQPVVTSHQNRFVTLYHESLLRHRHHGDEDYMSSGGMIDTFERMGLIEWLDASVLHTTIRLLQQHPDLQLGCNLSPLSLRRGVLWKELYKVLQDQPDLAARLILEITESAVGVNRAEAIVCLRTLHELGCRIALDDLGIGFNTLELAMHLRPDIVKLDKSLVHAARQPGGADKLKTITESLLPICTTVVAEGVETEDDLQHCLNAGVPALQGYLIGRPTVLTPWSQSPVAVKNRIHFASLGSGSR